MVRAERGGPGSDAAAQPLQIGLTRISPTHHRLDLQRHGGAREAVTLETRSVLLHDLVHFAVESEAGLADSFYGRVARGVGYGELAADGGAGGEILVTEKVVGAVQGAWRRGFEPAALAAALRGYFEGLGEAAPAWLTAELLQRVGERLRRLEGEWRALPFGQTMQLAFAPGRQA